MITQAGRRDNCAFRLGGVRRGAGVAALWLAGAALAASPLPSWPQWGRDPAHSGSAPVLGQPLAAILADVVYDPFVAAETAEGAGDLFVHYPVPLVEGDDVYMEFKAGAYMPCDPPGSGEPAPCGSDAWDSQVWTVKKLSWRGGALVERWTFESDWKPEWGAAWEPVFQPVLSGDSLFVPGLGATIHKVSKATGQGTRLNPFTDLNPLRHVAGGLAADRSGAVVYDAVEWPPVGDSGDVTGAWLVRIGTDGSTEKVSFASLVPRAPQATDGCQVSFAGADLPWPPSNDAVPPAFSCGSQRPGLNVVPAIAADGTIYTVSRAHRNDRYGYVLAVHPDLTPAWSASLRDILDDGCDVSIPESGTPGGCRDGSARGVDPATNDRPAGRVIDQSTSSPVVLPDGGVLYGAFTRYNFLRGHLFKFSPDGDALATYGFGWDITPAIREHDGTYSIVLKDNHYGTGSYCGDPDVCPFEDGWYDIVSLDPNLAPEWSLTNTTAEACARQPDGTLLCSSLPVAGFEWCVNQPAIDAAGITYANSEDGFLYAIGPDGRLRERIFLDLALGAAYTPVSLGPDGRIYAQNNGHLFVIGLPIVPREAPVRPSSSRHTRVVQRP